MIFKDFGLDCVAGLKATKEKAGSHICGCIRAVMLVSLYIYRSLRRKARLFMG